MMNTITVCHCYQISGLLFIYKGFGLKTWSTHNEKYNCRKLYKFLHTILSMEAVLSDDPGRYEQVLSSLKQGDLVLVLHNYSLPEHAGHELIIVQHDGERYENLLYVSGFNGFRMIQNNSFVGENKNVSISPGLDMLFVGSHEEVIDAFLRESVAAMDKAYTFQRVATIKSLDRMLRKSFYTPLTEVAQNQGSAAHAQV